MCGRYSLTTPAEAMAQLFGFTNPLPNLPARYNMAPTQFVPIVRAVPKETDGRATKGARELVQVRWGLVPAWARDLSMGAKMINARAESVAEKPAFRDAFRKRRCLIPADGFYEWQASGRGKRPFRIGLKGGTPEAMPLFAFAGLWEWWEKAADGVPVETCTIVTTEANLPLRPIHERMPVILQPGDYTTWLDPAAPLKDAQALLKPYAADAMLVYPVSARVNNVRFDDAACIAPENEAPPSVQPSLF